MKRSLTLLLASLLVVLGLTACGGSNNKQDQGNSDSAVVGGDTVGDNSTNANDGLTNNGTGTNESDKNGAAANNGTNSGDTLLDDAERGVDDAIQGTEDLLDDITGTPRNSNARIQKQNGVTRNHML